MIKVKGAYCNFIRENFLCLFEHSVSNGQNHKFDFLTVGSMGHSSSIFLGIAINKPEQRIWCIDGDGAVLMLTVKMVA